MLDVKFFKKWIKALRSGEYIQGKNNLCKDGRWCCLGVGCDISGKGTWMSTGFGDKKYVIGKDSHNGVMPFSLMEEIGLTWKHLGALVQMNDAKINSFSFKQIADYIESKILKPYLAKNKEIV